MRCEKAYFLAAAEQILGEDVVSQRVQGQKPMVLDGGVCTSVSVWVCHWEFVCLVCLILLLLKNLQPGMVIVQITKQNGPVKIRKSGLVSSDAMVQGLSEMGVQELEIDPEQTVEVAPLTPTSTPTSTHHRTQTQAFIVGASTIRRRASINH